ncbi:hypothetical protein TPHA_0A04320 [Tetrapisispora phaffii CBS 4417]|uniref:Importin N-terminal domain-containing protein n=1 Tax=Tetrapisispora phaffii (strain ATCC 24235 / CBS 4417 / NBRC 1672 / NRRL Y-8282 / UCD 70-5) TaxID=1071381 RepID=G8BNM8_TETPH|nr:hypothetical protein TPHA_0A04320 [Tetrapisispora phaffii CBS 4417]CCE61506.1 hypothetical protein TPHA_0A04320 [Tetrapisispora phaffii CBS 4417]
MSTSWTPDGSSIHQLATLLKNSMSPNPNESTTALDSLKSFQLQPEFFNYLCYILIEGETSEDLKAHFSVVDLQNNRATAGMLLKNSMLEKGGFVKGNHNIDYVKSHIIHGLYNSNNYLVSNVTGIVITTLFSTYYRQHRDDPTSMQLLSQLLKLISNGNEASAKALSKIMEDSAQFFQLEWAGNVRPMEFLVENIMKFISGPQFSPVIKAESIKCINNIIPLQTQAFIVKIDEFLNNIFSLAQSSEDDQIRSQICVSFAVLLEFRPDKLVDHLSGIIQFTLHIIGSVEDEKVAIEACEFLYSFATSPNMPEHLVQPFINDIVPVLLAKMVYNEDSILTFENSNEDDAFLEDKDEDIKPIAPRIVKKRDGNDAGDNEDDADDHEFGDIDTEWNLRKCSAATLDVITNVLPQHVISIAFSYLREHLTSEKWYVREATVLALGAMADGGMKYFDDQLPSLIPFLIEQMKDDWAPIRKMSCWTLSRFSPWILKDHTEFLLPVLEAILITLVDKKKDVQESAISSVAVFIENCDAEIIETLLYNELLQSFGKCFAVYKKKNLLILYDAVGRFAEKVELDDSAMQIILPNLISKWTALPDNDKELWPLLECLSCVATSLGDKFMPMAPEVYGRAYKILCNCVDLEIKSQNDPTVQVSEKDFIITSLDMIDGLVQGLGTASQELLFPQVTNDTTLLQVMVHCLQDPVHEVRQSVFALLGDIVYFYNPQILSGTLAQFLKFIGTEIMHNDDVDGVPALINAIWSLGLISERIDLKNYIIDLSRVILDLFTNTTIVLDSSVTENIAITIGRMALTHPEVFTSGVFCSDAIWNKWCESVKDLDILEEKTYAYMGFIKIVNITGDQVSMSDNTLSELIKGLSKDVEVSMFSEDVLSLLMKYASKIQTLKLTPDEQMFLQQFSSN